MHRQRIAGEVLPDLLPRISSAAQAALEAQDAWRLRTETRDQLIVDAVDAGVSQRAIARAAGIGHTRIIAILARSQALVDA